MPSTNTVFCPNKCEPDLLTVEDTAELHPANNGYERMTSQAEYLCEGCGWNALFTRGKSSTATGLGKMVVFFAGVGINDFLDDHPELDEDYMSWTADYHEILNTEF